MKTSNFVDKNTPTIKPVYNPTLTEIMRYVDNMVEDEWQEFVGLLEARGWTLDTATRKDEWCHDCKEYDQQKHYCPRFCRVIRETVEELKSKQPDFNTVEIINKAYDDGYEAGYLQGRHDWGDLDG